MFRLNRVLAIVFLIAAGQVGANSQTNAIDALVEKLNSSPLWTNGDFPIIELSSNATPQEVVESAVSKWSLEGGMISTFRILETRKVQLHGMPDCSAALIESDSGMKILLFRYSRGVGLKNDWWTRFFDAPEAAGLSAHKLPQRSVLADMIIPEFNYREAKPSEVFASLSDECKRLDPEHVGVNFIVRGEIDETNAVTITVHNVPLVEVLKYICAPIGLSYRIESNTVIISKTPSVSPAASPSPP